MKVNMYLCNVYMSHTIYRIHNIYLMDHYLTCRKLLPTV